MKVHGPFNGLQYVYSSVDGPGRSEGRQDPISCDSYRVPRQTRSTTWAGGKARRLTTSHFTVLVPYSPLITMSPCYITGLRAGNIKLHQARSFHCWLRCYRVGVWNRASFLLIRQRPWLLSPAQRRDHPRNYCDHWREASARLRLRRCGPRLERFKVRLASLKRPTFLSQRAWKT